MLARSKYLVYHSGKDGVQQAQVAACDEDEPQNDSRQRRDLLAVRPLHALELRPDVLEEVNDLTEAGALLARGSRVAAANAPGAGGGLGCDLVHRLVTEGSGLLGLELQLAVGRLLDVVVGVRLLERLHEGVRAAQVLGRRARCEVDLLLEVVAGRQATLARGLPRRAPGRLTLLCPLPVTG